MMGRREKQFAVAILVVVFGLCAWFAMSSRHQVGDLSEAIQNAKRQNQESRDALNNLRRAQGLEPK